MNLPPRYTPKNNFQKAGGQGEVTVWMDDLLERPVAVKKFIDHKVLGNEVESFSKVKSKHVVEVYDLQSDTSNQANEYLIMEFVDGKDLDSFEFKSLNEYLIVLFQVATGLNDIHACECIHRDIKPNNIIISESGIVKIIDFGIAAQIVPIDTIKGRGTLGFRGPEYYSQPRIINYSADVYAFGATAFYLATGGLTEEMDEQPPGPAPSFLDLDIKGERIDQEIARMLDKCLSPEPEKRPTSKNIATTIHRHLVKGQHQAKLYYSSKEYVINNSAPNLYVKNRFGINYDGIGFTLVDCEVPISVNNSPVCSGYRLPGSCVITIAMPGKYPEFIPVNLSNPEFVI